MVSNFNPLESLPADVSKALMRAGWIPGKSRLSRKSKAKVEAILREFNVGEDESYLYVEDSIHLAPNIVALSSARQVIEELYEIRVEDLPKFGPCTAQIVVFSCRLFKGLEDEVTLLSSLLRTQLVPVAEVLSYSILLLADNGYLYSLGFAAPGAYLEGRSFAEGLSRTLHGNTPRPVTFSPEQDPNGTFALDENHPLRELAFWPSPVTGAFGVDASMPLE